MRDAVWQHAHGTNAEAWVHVHQLLGEFYGPFPHHREPGVWFGGAGWSKLHEGELLLLL